MIDNKIFNYLENLKKEYQVYSNQKDEQSLFYLEQMNEVMYNELKVLINDKTALNDLIRHSFKKNINIIFNNMKDYFKKIIENQTSSIDEIIKMSMSNRYINKDYLDKAYKSFETELNQNINIFHKIKVLVTANQDALFEQIYYISNLDERKNIANIIKKYINFIQVEMI